MIALSETQIQQLDQANAEIMAIETQFGYSSWTEEQIKAHFNRGSSLVLLKNRRILGTLIYIQIDFEFEILSLSVLPEFRKQGIAQKLIEELSEKSQGLENGVVFLEVAESNHAAISLYKKCGFKILNRRSNYYKNGDGALQMELSR